MDADDWRLKQNTAFPDQSMVGKGGFFVFLPCMALER
jgi:hypothetical protein